MEFNTKVIAAVIIVFIMQPILIQAQQELPLHQKRLSEKVLVAWIGDYMQTISVVALATSKGIVVIETSLIRSHDARIRSAIEEAFGRNDFKYLINTHYHHDHTAGNQVYSDATIIGHKNVPAGMKTELTGDGLVNLVEKFKRMLKERESALKEAEPQSDQYKFTEEFITCLKLAIAELQSGFIPTYPSVLFEKNLTLDMGDMTLELYSFGGMHTDSDIIIFVPEEGLLAVGDVSPDRWIPYIRKDSTVDFTVTLEHWGKIAEDGREIKYVNIAHSDMFLSVESFKEQYRYTHTLWEGLTEMNRKGLTIEDAKKKYTLEEKFPYFFDERTKERRVMLHENNIEAIWERIAK